MAGSVHSAMAPSQAESNHVRVNKLVHEEFEKRVGAKAAEFRMASRRWSLVTILSYSVDS